MGITSTASYPEAFLAVLCAVGLALTGLTSALYISDVRRWDGGGMIWRRVLVTGRRNNLMRLTIFAAYEALVVVFMLTPDPARPEVAWALGMGYLLLLYSVCAMLWNAVFDYLDRQFIVRAREDSEQYARHLEEIGVVTRGHPHPDREDRP